MRTHHTLSIIGVPIVTMWLVGFVAHAAVQANVAFMPGDAFFHAKLTSDFVESLPKDGGNLTLVYSPVPMAGGFGGYAGFERMEIKGVPARMTSALRGLYRKLRRDYAKIVRVNVDANGKEVAKETNGFHLFVYNRDVKWKLEWHDQKIGIKYNEHWTDLPPEAITPSESRPSGFFGGPAIEYESFIETYAAVVEDWENARRFPELKVDIPKGIPWGLTGPEIMEPVSVDAKNIQLVICPDDSLKLYFQRKRDVEFFAVTVEGVKRFTWTKEGLVSEKYADEDGKKKGGP